MESQRYHRASPQALTCQESSSSVKGLVQGLSGPLCVLFKPEHQASGSGCLSLWTPGQLSGAEPLTEPLLRPWPHVPRLSPQVIENCVAAAGFSVGEFAALVFAGAMEFSEGTQEGVWFCAGVFSCWAHWGPRTRPKVVLEPLGC